MNSLHKDADPELWSKYNNKLTEAEKRMKDLQGGMKSSKGMLESIPSIIKKRRCCIFYHFLGNKRGKEIIGWVRPSHSSMGWPHRDMVGAIQFRLGLWIAFEIFIFDLLRTTLMEHSDTLNRKLTTQRVLDTSLRIWDIWRRAVLLLHQKFTHVAEYWESTISYLTLVSSISSTSESMMNKAGESVITSTFPSLTR